MISPADPLPDGLAPGKKFQKLPCCWRLACAIRLLVRLSGFASMNANFGGGCVTTQPYRFAGNTLLLNVKSDYGKVLVELLDEDDSPISGYSKTECVPVQTDGIDVPVRWKGQPSLTDLKGRPVKIKFHLFNAKLYSYRCK